MVDNFARFRHTGVVVYGNEYYFGGGIQHSLAGSTPYGTPIRVVDLGVTHVPKDVFEMYLQEISPRYTAETYSLLTHNCNNFSNEVAQFLVGATIPEYILQLPNEVMSSPMGALIRKFTFSVFVSYPITFPFGSWCAKRTEMFWSRLTFINFRDNCFCCLG